MGINVRLQTERGELIEEMIDWNETVSTFITHWDDTSFCCLRFIDEYGDTVFNTLQMESFLTEWERVSDRIETDEQRNVWNQVKTFAERCQKQSHTYLKFIGD
jgi:hypothetical protein